MQEFFCCCLCGTLHRQDSSQRLVITGRLEKLSSMSHGKLSEKAGLPASLFIQSVLAFSASWASAFTIPMASHTANVIETLQASHAPSTRECVHRKVYVLHIYARITLPKATSLNVSANLGTMCPTTQHSLTVSRRRLFEATQKSKQTVCTLQPGRVPSRL